MKFVRLAPKLAGEVTKIIPRNAKMAENRESNLHCCGRRELLVLATAGSRGSSQGPPPVLVLLGYGEKKDIFSILGVFGNKLVTLHSPFSSVRADVVIIFGIVVLQHQRRPHVGVRKLLQLAKGVIKFKALELSGPQLFAGTIDLMPDTAQELRRNCLGVTVVL